MPSAITKNSIETKSVGAKIAKIIKGGDDGIVCLTGNLGAGKTTFSQGFLKALGAKGPYTSPTFLIVKSYKKKLLNIYHIDAYRITSNDLINLGWKEMIAPPADGIRNIIIIEWAERVKKIIPKNALWIKFEWINENKRRIILPLEIKEKK